MNHQPYREFTRRYLTLSANKCKINSKCGRNKKWGMNGGKREIRKSKQNCNGVLTDSLSGNQQKMDVSGPCRPVSGCQIFVHLMGRGRGQRSEGMGPDKKAPKVSCRQPLRISWGRLGSALGVLANQNLPLRNCILVWLQCAG